MFKRFPKYKYILALFDYALLILSFAAAVWARFYEIPLSELVNSPMTGAHSAFILVYSLVWIVIFQHFNLYKINIFLSVTEQIIAIVKALVYGFIGLFVASYLIKRMDWIDSRAVIALFATFSLLSVTLFRTIVFRKLFVLAAKNKFFLRRVLIIGTDRTAKMVAVQLDLDDSHGFSVVGFVDDKLPKDARIFEDFRVLGKIRDLKKLVKEYAADEIIIAQSEITHEELLALIDKAKETRATVRLVSELYSIVPEKVLVEKYLDVPVVMMTQMQDSLIFRVYKRVFDFVVSIFALVVLAVPFLLIALVIKATSKGPVFYKHTRIGKDNAPFEFYKFRTMIVNSDDTIHRDFVRNHIRQSGDKDSPEVKKIVDDPRITPFGGFLRKTSLDELPQLFNVLRGEMSLVGPRPCLPYELEQYELWHHRRFSVTPGCTGLWQVSGRSSVDFNDMVILDLFYINNMSPFFDLKIVFKTIPVMLLAKGGY